MSVSWVLGGGKGVIPPEILISWIKNWCVLWYEGFLSLKRDLKCFACRTQRSVTYAYYCRAAELAKCSCLRFDFENDMARKCIQNKCKDQMNAAGLCVRQCLACFAKVSGGFIQYFPPWRFQSELEKQSITFGKPELLNDAVLLTFFILMALSEARSDKIKK